MSPAIAISTTVGTEIDARTIARTLVERRLVACAQISKIDSLYRWEGAVREETEYCLLLKTVETRRADVEAALRALHPYELPEIHSQRLEQVDAAYAAWVAAESAGGG